MSGDQTVVRSGGIGILGLLGCIFVTLKLTGVITWSWWWVTAPFWGGFALVITIILVTALLITLNLALEAWKD